MKGKLLALLGSICLVLVLAVLPFMMACGEQPTEGGILKIIHSQTVTNLGRPDEPCGIADREYSSPCVEFLVVRENVGGEMIIQPWLATDWEMSSDYKSITFTLREDVKFHDGTDFNAETVKYCLDLTRESPVAGELGAIVESVEVVDEYTVRVNLLEYEAGVLYYFAHFPALMVSPTALETMGDECMLHPVGTGPFKFVSYQTDVSLKYERFDDYWQEGKPYLDGIEFSIVADPVTSLISLQAGEAHACCEVTPQDAIDLEATGEYNINQRMSGPVGLAGDSLNPDSPFADIRVRQAIAHAIDNAAVAEAVGLATPFDQWFHPMSYAYNPDVVGYPYDPDKAMDLLAEAAADGVFEPNDLGGFDTEITYPGGGNRDIFMTVVQSYLADVGIEADLESVDFSRFMQIAQTEGWHNSLVWAMAVGGSAVETDPISIMRRCWTTQPGGWYRVSMYIPYDVFDPLISEAGAEPDFEERKAMYQEISRLLIDEYCVEIPVFASSSLMVYSIKAHDVGLYVETNYHLEDAWLSE